METISITIRGETYSYQIAEQAVDLALAAFTDAHVPAQVSTVEGDANHPGTKIMPPAEHMARRLRIYAEEVVAGYASKLDDQITPNMDAVRQFITGG